MSMIRTRWAAIGAAVAITLGGGGVGLVSATVSSGPKPVLVPITPCRIIDTRPAHQVGPRSTPLGTADTHTVTAHGTNGDCTIPTDAVALSMNVTAVQATLPTFLTIWATGEPMPDASSLNPFPGQPPAPNAVSTELSPDGRFDIYNLQGDVHVLADVNGYYVDHTHDDRYYTEAEVDAKLDALHATETRYLSVPPAAFSPRWPSDTQYFIGASGELIVSGGTEDQFHAPLDLPDGAQIEALHAWVTDSSLFGPPVGSLEIVVFGLSYDGGYTRMLQVDSTYQPSPTKLTDTTFDSRLPSVVDNETWMYVVRVRATGDDWSALGSDLQLEGVTIEYTTDG
jgi:hypothetical protein